MAASPSNASSPIDMSDARHSPGRSIRPRRRRPPAVPHVQCRPGCRAGGTLRERRGAAGATRTPTAASAASARRGEPTDHVRWTGGSRPDVPLPRAREPLLGRQLRLRRDGHARDLADLAHVLPLGVRVPAAPRASPGSSSAPNWRAALREWPLHLLQSLLGLTGYTLLLYAALGLTGAVNAAVISAINPATIALGAAIFLHERLEPGAGARPRRRVRRRHGRAHGRRRRAGRSSRASASATCSSIGSVLAWTVVLARSRAAW